MKPQKLLLLLTILVFCLSLDVSAQVMGKRAPAERAKTEAKPEVTTGLATGADKVEVMAFSIEPADPKEGQEVTVKMTVKNKGDESLSGVPWRIAKDNKLLGEGTQDEVAAGETFEVTATYTAEAGEHHFYGDADPKNVLKESKAALKNNTKAADASVPQVSASTAGGGQVELETQALNYKKAKEAGASFADKVEGPTLCTPVGQFEGTSHADYWGRGWHRPLDMDNTVLFFINCASVFSSGAKANPEAFNNFTLKNGWKVKDIIVDVRFYPGSDSVGPADWQWVSRPNKGNDKPYMKMHLVANKSQLVYVYVKVLIEGPPGTDPYY
jgi:hypothetical protein